MSSPKKEGLIERWSLNESELSEIEQLARLCNQHEGLDLKLNWNSLRTRSGEWCNDLLFYADDQLVGFLALFTFNSREGEVSGMVHPNYRRRGIGGSLWRSMVQHARQRGIPRLLLIAERASFSGQCFAHALPAIYEHSEYKMVLEEPRFPENGNERLLYRSAGPNDLQALAFITAQAFDLPEEDVSWYSGEGLSLANSQWYVGVVDGVVVGKIDVRITGDTGSIFGFAVLSAYQGQGYGRQILVHTVQQLLKNGQQHIWLEVNTSNEHALGLYQSCGFQATGCYDYYNFSLV